MTLISRIWQRIMPDITIRRRIDGDIYHLSLRDHLYWLFPSGDALAEQVPWPKHQLVWDVGCNIGLHSMRAARRGCHVVAFDISSRNLDLLQLTAHLWGKADHISTVHSPLTCTPVKWTPSPSAHTESKCAFGLGDRYSTTYLCATLYGTPSFIKMDIEGAEIEFLNNIYFKQWLFANDITWYVELHNGNKPWPEMRQVDSTHYIYEP